MRAYSLKALTIFFMASTCSQSSASSDPGFGVFGGMLAGNGDASARPKAGLASTDSLFHAPADAHLPRQHCAAPVTRRYIIDNNYHSITTPDDLQLRATTDQHLSPVFPEYETSSCHD
jgi:hypothetical protein